MADRIPPPKDPHEDHALPCPFPRTLPNGRVVLDEICYCGKLRTQHHDTFSYGHGDSGACPKFTWAGCIYQEDDDAA